MAQTKNHKPVGEFIVPLNMNGLQGRMLKLPAKNKKKVADILMIYGMHASLERMFGFAEFMSQYGNVTIPDLPGYGGMESFHRIKERPTLDNFANYLASFIKLRYRNKKFKIVAISYGFVIATRMLQLYPEIAKHVTLLVSVAGFTNYQDFKLPRPTFVFYKYGTVFFSHKLPAVFFRHVVLQPFIVRQALTAVERRHPKFKHDDAAVRRERIHFEVVLWQINDVRTYMSCGQAMFRLSLGGMHVNLPVHHIAISSDKYFDNTKVEQNMRAIYSDFNLHKANLPAHAPTVLATAEEVAPFVPSAVRRLLNKH